MMLTLARAVGLAAAVVAAGAAQTALAPVAIQLNRTFGLIGVAERQTARLNVANVAAQLAPGTTPVVACTSVLSFLDATGSVIKTATVTVAPGGGQWLDLDGDVDLQLAAGERREIRATLQSPMLPPSGTATTAVFPEGCRLIPTLEIFNHLTGRTEVVLGAAHVVASATPVAGTTTVQ